MEPLRTRVVIADDALLIRQGLRMVLETLEGIELVAEAEDLPTLLAAVDEHHPEVVITDIRMPPTNSDEGVEAALRIRRAHADIGVIVLSQHAEPGFIVTLLENGTERLGYLLKENIGDRAEIQRAIDAVVAGGSAIDPAVVEVLVQSRTAASSPIEQLTPRERDVLALIAEGLNNAGIAAALVLSEKAVEKHINSIFSKLQLGEELDTHRRVRAVLLWLAG